MAAESNMGLHRHHHRQGFMPPVPPNPHVFSFQSPSSSSAAARGVGNFFPASSIGPGGPSCSGSGMDPVGGGGTVAMMKPQDYDLSPEWTIEEEKILKQGLLRYATESSITKYLKIASMLPRKTVRDVALRCRWIADKMMGSYSRANTQTITHGNTSSFSPVTNHANQNVQFLHEAPVLDSSSQHMVEENTRILHQISANLSSYQAYKIQDNINLFCHLGNNFTTLLNNMNNMPGIMSRMRPLPVSINEELLHAILPSSDQGFMFDGAGIH